MAETLYLEGAEPRRDRCELSTETEADSVAMRLSGDLASVCGVVNATAARRVGVVSELLATEAWTGPGVRSAAHFVGWQCGVSPAHARDLVQMARRLPDMPVTRGLFDAGQLSEDHVKVICRRVPDAYEAEVAELALALTFTQLSHIVAEYPFHADPEEDQAHDDPDAPEPRRVSFGPISDRLWRLHAQLHPDEGKSLEKALLAARDDLFAECDAQAGGDKELAAKLRHQVSWADAMVRLGDSYLGGRTRAGTVRDRYRVLIHLNAQRRFDPDPADPDPDPGPVEPHANFHLGSALPDSLRRMITCDGDLTPVFTYRGVVNRIGTSTRTIPDRLRIAVEQRDKGCRVPSCGRTLWLQIHHIVHWEHGGPTQTANLCALCSTHHRQHHDGGLGITGNADTSDGLTFTDQSGRVLKPPGAPPPVRGHPYDAARALAIPVAPYDCARHERAAWRWLKLYPRPPTDPSRN